MQKVGWSLLDENNNEIDAWGRILGEDVSIPGILFLPDDTQIHAPNPGLLPGGLSNRYMLVERWIDGDKSKEFLKSGETATFDGEKYIITWQYRQPTEEEYATAIQKHIDTTAQSKNYKDGFALSTYDSSTIASWAAEAQTFVAWRDAVWTYSFIELEKVKNGLRPQPSIEEIIAELPVITWP